MPPLLNGFNPWLAQLNPILEVLRKYKHELTSVMANIAAATNGVFFDPTLGKSFHYLRTEAPLQPEAISTYPNRLQVSRSNPYVKPKGFLDVKTTMKSFEVRQCSMGINAFLDPNSPTDPDFNARFGGDVALAQAFFDRLKKFAFNDQLTTQDITAAACNQQSPYSSIGVNPDQSQYLHVRPFP